jgi:hypothetical protein
MSPTSMGTAFKICHLTACRCPSGCPSCVLPAFSRYEIAMEPSIKEFPYPKEAAHFLIHELLEKEPYVPRLEPGAAGRREAALEPQEPLDPRLAGRVRRAIKHL